MELCKMKQGTFYFHVADLRGTLPCNDHNVQTTIEHALVQSVAFSNQSGNSMPYHTVSYFFTHADPNPVHFQAIFLDYHYKILIGNWSAIFVNELELVIFP